jgi:hypothetical protein
VSVRAIAAATVVALVLLAPRASAQPFPARSGERGILDVPDAEVSGVGGGQLAAELRFDHRPGVQDEFGPMPLYAVTGITDRLDLGLSVRESGQPDDPRPSRALFGAAMKLQLLARDGPLPAAAVGAVFDRINGRGVLGARLSLSTAAHPLRLAAFAGGEAEVSGFRNAGVTAGVAASFTVARRVDLAAEALTGPRGESFGAAVRWHDGKTMGVSIGGNYFPQEEAFRIALTFAFAPPPARPQVVPQIAVPELPPEELATGPRFLDDRPRFRLRIPMSGPQQLGVAQRQHGPFVTPTAVAAAPARPVEAAGVKAAAPTLEDLAEAQVRDQEVLADARQKRVRAAGEQLDAREEAATAEAARLAGRERDLAAREQQLEAREKRTVVRTPSQPQRQLESLVAQIASEERNLAAQERSYVPALDAASARERNAATREQQESAEAGRLASSVRSEMPRAAQVDLRKQALAARNRQLAAMETRLLARGERIDAFERQLRTRNERVNAWARRLDARVERLELIEKLLEPARTPPPAPPKPADDKEAAAPPKDKPVFVMVVKAPTAIVKERAGGAAGAAAGGSSSGVAVEKAVIAATVVMFPTPTTQLSELDRETLDNIAKLAAKSGGELLIWARAKDPSLVAEAERRAAEIRARASTAGPLDAGRITTRITMRPGAQGVDVVVSALRETAKPPDAAPETGAAGTRLQSGESGKRQIRDAVQSAQPSIEACVGEHLQRKRLQRGEGTLKVTVSPQGRVRKTTAGADFAGDEIEACLTAASATWLFPTAEGEYVVDVPITVMSGGAPR